MLPQENYIMDDKALYAKLMEIKEFLSKSIEVLKTLHRVASQSRDVSLTNHTASAMVNLNNISNDLTPYINDLREALGTTAVPIEKSNNNTIIIVDVSSNIKH